MNKNSHYFPELDTLRFVAFLLVLIHHTPFMKDIPLWDVTHNFGWVGVDIFLCLSAFLFAKLLFAEHQETGNINIPHFYIRRALRIWPLYFVFIAFILILSILEKGWSSDMAVRLIGLLTFTDNIFTVFLGYNLIFLYVAHLWTISYEEQVYLIIPWLLRFFYRHKTSINWIVLGAIALIFMSIRAVLIQTQVNHPAIWVLPVAHFESVLGGLIIGLGLIDDLLKRIPHWLQLILGITALYLVTLLPNIFLIQWNLMLTYPLVGIGVTLILSSVLHSKLGIISSWMKQEIPRYLGKISYGLYVYHISVIALVKAQVSKWLLPDTFLYAITILFLTLILSILIASFSYELLEKPFQKLKSKFSIIQSRSA